MEPEVQIPLWRRGKLVAYATVDSADLPRLSRFIWHPHESTPGYRYAERYVGKRTVFMHRELLGLREGDKIHVDHVNGDGLDNRRANIRRAQVHENLQNRHSLIPHSSIFRGVSRERDSRGRTGGWWLAQLKLRGVKYRRRFASELDAAEWAASMRRSLMPFSQEARETGQHDAGSIGA